MSYFTATSRKYSSSTPCWQLGKLICTCWQLGKLICTAFIGIGSNLGDRRACCERAVTLLRKHPAMVVEAVSPWKEYPALTSRPDEMQPPYMNGAVQLSTMLSPDGLLACCLAIERQMGRVRDPDHRWAPRLIDLDILLYDDLILDTPTLTIPHPELTKRVFVLEPLAMIAPDMGHPVHHKSITELRRLICNSS